jgi:hypothetical protein
MKTLIRMSSLALVLVFTALCQTEAPRNETEFVSTIRSYQDRYKSAPNEFRKSTLRRERATDLARILTDRCANRWVGMVRWIHTEGQGNGSIAIDPLEFQHGALSVGMLNSSVKIVPGSPLYQKISELVVGARVVFTGIFETGSGLDYLRETSLTENGSMTDPEFDFDFVSIEQP